MEKKGQVWSEFGKWIIGAAVLVIALLFIYSISTGRLADAIQHLQDLLRFGS